MLQRGKNRRVSDGTAGVRAAGSLIFDALSPITSKSFLEWAATALPPFPPEFVGSLPESLLVLFGEEAKSAPAAPPADDSVLWLIKLPISRDLSSEEVCGQLVWQKEGSLLATMPLTVKRFVIVSAIIEKALKDGADEAEQKEPRRRRCNRHDINVAIDAFTDEHMVDDHFAQTRKDLSTFVARLCENMESRRMGGLILGRLADGCYLDVPPSQIRILDVAEFVGRSAAGALAGLDP